MSSEPSTPDLAETLAGAEWRRMVLERLVLMGMTVAEAMEERAVQGGEARQCAGKAFAAVSRAVRLTLAMHAATEADILAMRKGTFTPPELAPECVGERPVGRVRRLVHLAVREAIDREVAEAEVAREARERLDERLIEREDFTALLALPFRECVEAICAELGLEPNWTRPVVMAGFARPDRTADRPPEAGFQTPGAPPPWEPAPVRVGERRLE